MNYQELLNQAEAKGSVKVPTPPKFEKLRLYSWVAHHAVFHGSSISDEFNFILVGEECEEGINTAEDLKAALPPMENYHAN